MESYRIGNLPEELVHEILLRLPVKALLVCKCVCKDWCALIKSPSFINRHFNHESNQECLVFYGEHVFLDEDDEEVDEDAFFMYDDERHSLVEAPNYLLQMPTLMITEGVVKGIFCLRSSFSLGLFNPATREFKKLPPIPHLHNQGIEDLPWIGFGLDPSSGDFKVVAFKHSKKCNYASVYNLSTESWKTVETLDLYDKIGYYSCDGIPTLNGFKHWLTKFADSDVYSIIAFDMRSEKFREIAVPEAISKTKKSLDITTYCDLVAVFLHNGKECIDLWLMGRDGLWSKTFSIGPLQDFIWPLLVWKKNKVFIESSDLVMCDVSTQKVTTVQPMDPRMDPITFLSGCFIFKESLVSIKGERVVDSLQVCFD